MVSQEGQNPGPVTGSGSAETSQPPKGSGVLRLNIEGIGKARCVSCDWTRAGGWALAQAQAHVRKTGHVIHAEYRSEFVYTADPRSA